jgi:hypothetical protein
VGGAWKEASGRGMMKGNGGRSRVREAPQFERDPFGLGLRQKSVPAVETPKRRGRDNGERMATDGVASVSISSKTRTLKFSPQTH